MENNQKNKLLKMQMKTKIHSFLSKKSIKVYKRRQLK